MAKSAKFIVAGRVDERIAAEKYNESENAK